MLIQSWGIIQALVSAQAWDLTRELISFLEDNNDCTIIGYNIVIKYKKFK